MFPYILAVFIDASLHWSDIYFEEQLMYVRKSYATIRNEEQLALLYVYQ